ncbi:hypothetical protein WR25_22923 [Diploscapter pachys]|uniref:BAR domain-containing protein n=1 Tax=Diploscapter pachys TaxID=2018661 RepID=A0A2A2L2R5_9BILA|nr:hypothetical protein WR25_22923 [Diploscapter pachys]
MFAPLDSAHRTKQSDIQFGNLDIQSNDLEKAVCEDLPQSVSQYVQQFADLKKKVDKRGRKLVDYDHAKNQFASAKASSKKVDSDPKIAKTQQELQQAQDLYLEINKELLEILPATYDSRITYFVDTLQSLFNAQSIYQTEAAKIHKQIVSQLDRLGESMDYLRVTRPEPRSVTPIDGVSTGQGNGKGNASPENASRQSTPSPVQIPVPVTPSNDNTSQHRQSQVSRASEDKGNPFGSDDDTNQQEEKFENKVYPKLAQAPPTASPRSETREKAKAPPPKPKKEKDPTNPFDEDSEEEGGKDNVAPENPNAPPGITTEQRSVLEAKASDELDEGWRLGELSNGKRGVFPENFTKKT